MEHAALKGRAVCFSRDILLQILPGNRTNYLWCSKKMLAHVITSCHGSWIPFPLRTFLGQVCYVVQLPKYLWFPTMLILPKDSWTNKTHVVYFLLDLIQWFWPHPEKVHAQEKQSKKRAAITKEKKKAGVTCCSPRGKDWRIYLGSFLPALSFLLCSFCPGFLSSSPFLFLIMFCLTLPLLSSPTCLPLCHTSFLRLCALYSPTILLPPVILSLPRMLFIHNSSLPFTLPLQILHPPSSTPLPPMLHFLFSPFFSFLQLTFVTRKCSCARTEERATRTWSASVLQSSRGYCANIRAVRRARTAAALLCRTLPRPPCCSALC